MPDEDEAPKQKSGSELTLFLALAIAVVTIAIGWVGWSCIDSLQNNAGKLHKYNVNANNTKIDSHHLDIVKNDLDARALDEKLAPTEYFQAILVKQEGSELTYSQAFNAQKNKQYTQAVRQYSQVLDMIPNEAKKKSSFYFSGGRASTATYTSCTLRLRGICYRELKDYPHAIADLTAAINLRPDKIVNYQRRAEIYYLQGKKALGDNDTQTWQAMH